MGVTYWTSAWIGILACVHMSHQETAPAVIHTSSYDELIAPSHVSPTFPETEDAPTPMPSWSLDNEAPFFDESPTEQSVISSLNNYVPSLGSEQLQNVVLPFNKTQTDNESMPSITPNYKLINRYLTDLAEEPPTSALVMNSQSSTSPWPELSTMALFTASIPPIDPIREPELSMDNQLDHLEKTEDGLSSIDPSSVSHSDAVTDFPVQPFIWEISGKGDTDLLTPEEETAEEETFIEHKNNDTDETPFTDSTSLVPSNAYSVKKVEDSTMQYRNDTKETISTFAMSENITDLNVILPGSTTVEDTSTWGCYPGSEKCEAAVTQSPTPHEADPTLHGYSLLSSPPIFITLHADWNSSVADWGIAWEALVYGSVGLYGTVALLALLSIFCLVFRCPSGGFYFAVLHLLLICFGGSRAFALFYDAYGHQDRLPIFTALLLHDLAFPCMTTSFSIVFLLLCSRCRLQNSSSPILPRVCIFASAAFLHFITAGGAVVAVDIFHQYPFLLLVSRGVYVGLTVLLSFSFFIFCCIANTQNSQIYDLKSSAPPAEYSSGCPFANLKDWSRATYIALFSAFFGILNAGLQLYAMLYAMGYGGSIVFGPWPWWTFQLSSSLCEVGICLPLALIGAYPIFCANEIGRTNCWTQLFRLSPGHVAMKAPMLQNSKWASSQHEKLLICDTIVRSESEFFPLYTVVEKRLSNGEDLSLIYHSNKSLEIQGLSLQGSKTPSLISVQVDSDSTVDFHPPSPINLRRSIDEALFSDALIPKSLFHGTALCSSLSLTVKSATQLEDCVFKEKPADRGLYRTSSCMEIETGLPILQAAPSAARHETPASSASPEVWRGEQSTASSICKISIDGSSLVLCSSPEQAASSAHSFKGKQEPLWQSKAIYHTLTPPSQESLEVAAQPGSSLRGDLIEVFGPIDALSVCSETIDL
ncbi:proline-rich transmembrane protein 4 [Gastrophryne carolinensis]